MIINLWYSKDLKKWRWILNHQQGNKVGLGAYGYLRQESGEQEDIHEAMKDIANTVEYLAKDVE